MKIIADLHTHSRYSRAVSDKMVLAQIAQWAGLKGVDLVGSGDFTHPLWVREIVANLKEVADGIFSLKQDVLKNSARAGNLKHTLFILQQEISSIYSQGGQGRRIHNLVYAPSIKVVARINKELLKRGCNLMSDGRPIIGLSSVELMELVLGIDERCLVVPAHVWTPWFSLYGSKSGFDSIAECFGKYAKHIYAIETGLSSDPAMNWRISELEERAIISSSDAHSGPKLGREATIFEVPGEKITYRDIYAAIKSANYRDKTKPRIAGTIEFYPQEGKYHYTGHRNCGVRYAPAETGKKGTTCPVCGKPLTVGVMQRVEDLAERELLEEALPKKQDNNGVRWIFHPKNKKPPYVSMVPLMEILGEVLNSGVNTQKVINEYNKLTKALNSEFYVLFKAKLEDIGGISGEKIARAVQKVRTGDIFVDPGYDGKFGKVKIEREAETGAAGGREQLGIF